MCINCLNKPFIYFQAVLSSIKQTAIHVGLLPCD
nr:MAG TPA: hypothetical protein [Caudoviricetes sp.]